MADVPSLLLLLPYEVRAQIYSYLFLKPLTQPKRYNVITPVTPLCPRNILTVCRQILNEFLEEYYKVATFRLHLLGCYGHTKYLSVSIHARRMHNLEIVFGNDNPQELDALALHAESAFGRLLRKGTSELRNVTVSWDEYLGRSSDPNGRGRTPPLDYLQQWVAAQERDVKIDKGHVARYDEFGRRKQDNIITQSVGEKIDALVAESRKPRKEGPRLRVPP